MIRGMKEMEREVPGRLSYELIRQKRIERELTQSQLAGLIGVKQQTVARWESGQVNDIRPQHVRALCQVLGISQKELLEEGNPPRSLRGAEPYDEEEGWFDAHRMYTRLKTFSELQSLPKTYEVLSFVQGVFQGSYLEGTNRIPFVTRPFVMACHACAMGIREDDLYTAILLADVPQPLEELKELGVSLAVLDVLRLLRRRKSSGLVQGEEEYYGNLCERPEASLVRLLAICFDLFAVSKHRDVEKEKLAELVREAETYVPPLIRSIKQKQKYASYSFLLEYQVHSVLQALRQGLEGWGS